MALDMLDSFQQGLILNELRELNSRQSGNYVTVDEYNAMVARYDRKYKSLIDKYNQMIHEESAEFNKKTAEYANLRGQRDAALIVIKDLYKKLEEEGWTCNKENQMNYIKETGQRYEDSYREDCRKAGSPCPE